MLKIFEPMINQTFDSVTVYDYNTIPEHILKIIDRECCVHPEETLVFESSSLVVAFFHSQECCESVTIKEIVGDLTDLCNSPILEAELVKEEDESEYESRTFSFYKFRTTRGFVTVTWLGISNGYYSETVDFYCFNK